MRRALLFLLVFAACAPASVLFDVDVKDDGPPKIAAAPRNFQKRLTVDSTANVEVTYGSTLKHLFARCYNTTTGVSLYIVESGDSDTSDGTGPFCDTCMQGSALPPLGVAYLRTSAGTATVSCDFVESWPSGVSLGGGGGIGLGAVESTFLRLDATNDPVTGALNLSSSLVVGSAAAVDSDSMLDVHGRVRLRSVTESLIGTDGVVAFNTTSGATSVFGDRLRIWASDAGGPEFGAKEVNGREALFAVISFAGDGIGTGLGVRGDAAMSPDTAATSSWVLGPDLDSYLEVRNAYARFSDVVLYPDGAATTPVVTFFADQDTGIYRVGTNAIGIATAGQLQMKITDTSIAAYNPITDEGGSLADSPLLAFDGDTGFFDGGLDVIGVSVAGVQELEITASFLRPTTAQGMSLGNATLPFATVGTASLVGPSDSTALGVDDADGFTFSSSGLTTLAIAAGGGLTAKGTNNNFQGTDSNTDLLIQTATASSSGTLVQWLDTRTTLNASACDAAGEVGALVLYSDSGTSKISFCVCVQTAGSTFAWEGIHASADCSG